VDGYDDGEYNDFREPSEQGFGSFA